MTGPEHYRRAEELLRNAYDAEPRCPEEASALAAAQVHAMLALAAATVIGTLHSPAQFRAWREAVQDTADGEAGDDQ